MYEQVQTAVKRCTLATLLASHNHGNNGCIPQSIAGAEPSTRPDVRKGQQGSNEASDGRDDQDDQDGRLLLCDF